MKTSNNPAQRLPYKNQQTEEPLSHYLSMYHSLDPQEIAQRCSLKFDGSSFNLRVLGTDYLVPHPEFALREKGGNEVSSPYEKILILRYLCEGKYVIPQGKQLSYMEVPSGPLYFRNFEGRCLKRCAFTFGKDIPRFKTMIEQNPQLRAIPLKTGDAAYRLEFLSDLYITVILYGPDDEFQPSAQILFEDNFTSAYTAEDLAVVGEVLISRLKKLSASLT